MTEHFSDSSDEFSENLPTRRRLRAHGAAGSSLPGGSAAGDGGVGAAESGDAGADAGAGSAEWWNQPPTGGTYEAASGGEGAGGATGGFAGGYGEGPGEVDSGSYGEADAYRTPAAGAGAELDARPDLDGAAAFRGGPIIDSVPAGVPGMQETGMQETGLPESGMREGGAGLTASLPPLPAGMPEPPHQPGSRAEARTERGRQEGRRASFLDLQPAVIPATKGFRGWLAGLGLRMSPSADELAERRDMRAVSRHWPGPRTISVVNGKGGANKTPTTVMLAAVFARNGGGPVLAWDNNETRGTLGWRTEQGPHEATVMDLLPQTSDLLSPSAQSALLARFVHHQVEDKFDVLRSKPDVLASEQKITAADFDALHEVASKYFRLNIVDSGNDESAERWLRMIDHTHQLVIATTTVEEHAEAGALLLEALAARGGRYAELAQNAVVIVSQSDRNGTDAQARHVADGFARLSRAAVTIPYDPALRKGQIRYESLKPAARRAWLAAAAAVAEGL